MTQNAFRFEGSAGRCQICQGLLLESQICNRVPFAVAPPGSSRYRPDCGLRRWPSATATHCCAGEPLQSQNLDLVTVGRALTGHIQALAQSPDRAVP